MDDVREPETPAGDPVCWLPLLCDECGAIREHGGCRCTASAPAG